MSPTNAFTTASLITLDRLADKPEAALSAIPYGLTLPSDRTPIQTALLAELNRFPGPTHFAFIPQGAARAAALLEAEQRAKQWEATNRKSLAQMVGYLTVSLYLGNLRQLFLGADIETGQADLAAEEEGATVKDLVWYEHLDDTLALLAEPAFAIGFALDNVPSFMVPDFLEDWRSGGDMRQWLENLKADLLLPGDRD